MQLVSSSKAPATTSPLLSGIGYTQAARFSVCVCASRGADMQLVFPAAAYSHLLLSGAMTHETNCACESKEDSEAASKNLQRVVFIFRSYAQPKGAVGISLAGQQATVRSHPARSFRLAGNEHE